MLSFDDIKAAARRIEGKVHHTPLMTSTALDAMAGASLYFKCENLQKGGAFKARGATNAVFSLSPQEAARGVATHSSGNHGAALARAARLRGVSSWIVMPANAPAAKRAAVEREGAEVITCEPTMEAREAAVVKVLARTGATMIHPYNDPRVMAGQGTLALEMLADQPDLDLILCQVGGGGLISGVATAAKGAKPSIRVIGVEPAGADDAQRSFRADSLQPLGKVDTVADGLRASLGPLPFEAIRHKVDDIVTVSDPAIIAAMRSIWEVLKIVVEPSGAVAYAAVGSGAASVRGLKVGVVITGGNLDLDSLPWSAKSL